MKVIRPYKEFQSKLFLTTDLSERELLAISDVLRALKKYKDIALKMYEISLQDYSNFEIDNISLSKGRSGHVLNVILRSIISPEAFKEFGVTIDLNNISNTYQYPNIP